VQAVTAAGASLTWLLALAEAAADGKLSWADLRRNATAAATATARGARTALVDARRRAVRGAVDAGARACGAAAARAHAAARGVLGPTYWEAAAAAVEHLRPLVLARPMAEREIERGVCVCGGTDRASERTGNGEGEEDREVIREQASKRSRGMVGGWEGGREGGRER
jgi:hypothetical protein